MRSGTPWRHKEKQGKTTPQESRITKNEGSWLEREKKNRNVFERKILPTKCDLSARFKGTLLRSCQRQTKNLVRHRAIGIKKAWQHFSYRSSSLFSKDQSNWVNSQHLQPIETESTGSTLNQSNWVNSHHFQTMKTEITSTTFNQSKLSQLTPLSANGNWYNWHRFHPIELSQLAALSSNQTEKHHFQPIELSQLGPLSANWNWVNWHHLRKLRQLAPLTANGNWDNWHHLQPMETESPGTTFSQIHLDGHYSTSKAVIFYLLWQTNEKKAARKDA